MASSSAPLANNLSLYRYKRTNKRYTEALGNNVVLMLMLMPAGDFLMGAPEAESKSETRERPQHLVNVPQFLRLCRKYFLVTNEVSGSRSVKR